MPLYDFKCLECGRVVEVPATPDLRWIDAACAPTQRVCRLHRQVCAPKVQVAMKDRAVMPPLDKYDGIK